MPEPPVIAGLASTCGNRRRALIRACPAVAACYFDRSFGIGDRAGEEGFGIDAELRSSSSVGLYSTRQSGHSRADQALREQPDQRRGDQERLDPHVDQAGDRAGGVVGVERGEHQVAGERGAGWRSRRFRVADLADHDDVGVLAQEASAAPLAKVRPIFGLTCTWEMPLELVLDRILDGEDVEVRRVDR